MSVANGDVSADGCAVWLCGMVCTAGWALPPPLAR